MSEPSGGKHIFFYLPDCDNCKMLLSKIQGTFLQPMFIYINVNQAQRLPPNIKGVPAILPAYQPEISLLQGANAFRWIEGALSKFSGERPVLRTHPDPHGPVNPREFDKPPGGGGGGGMGGSVDYYPGGGGGGGSGGGGMGGGGSGGGGGVHRPVAIDSGGAYAATTPGMVLGNSPYEMGGMGYSDKYSFIDNTAGLAHRYSYVGEHSGPGVVGQRVTKEPGDVLRDAQGVTAKSKQLEMDLKRLQSARDSIPNGVRRIG